MTSAANLGLLSLADLSTLISAKTISPVALVQTYLDRIAAIDGQLNSFNFLRADSALEDAASAE
jgi:aspartyl-tRNA(Asn)/glutamyl-tRNA(Gln) amidotransferase subunit A